MKTHSRHIIHIGINFVTIPVPTISSQTFLLFQQAVMTHGLEFGKTERTGTQLSMMRESPVPLQVTVASLSPQMVGQLVVVAPSQIPLELFIQETEAVVNAFSDVWPAEGRQVVHGDATIRELFETTSAHAFQELWETRLGQSAQSLATFGRPVRGGGLRLILDPNPGDDEPAHVEIKIESFLPDSTKIFVETQFAWLQPSAPGTPFRTRERLEQMNAFVENQVHAFLLGEAK